MFLNIQMQVPRRILILEKNVVYLLFCYFFTVLCHFVIFSSACVLYRLFNLYLSAF